MNRRISIAIASLLLVVLSLAVLFYIDRFWVDKSTIYFRQKDLQDGILTYVLCFNRPPENLINVVDSNFLPKKSHLYRYPVGFHEKEPNPIDGNCLIEHHQGRIIVGYLISGQLVSNPSLTNKLNEQVNDILNRKIKEPSPTH